MSLKNNDPNTFKFQWNGTRADGSTDTGEVVYTDITENEMKTLFTIIGLTMGRMPAELVDLDDKGEYKSQL